MKHIAIILARGGSKRLPKKNILDFFGKPMLAWTVEAALQSQQFDRVLVSTDDEEIAAIGRDYGAEVPFLRQTAADDIATSSEATLAALAQAESHWGEQYDTVSQLMANCPLRGAKDTAAAVQAFSAGDAESQISCFQVGWANPWWAAKIDDKGKPSYVFPQFLASRSQDLDPLYFPTGAIWIARSCVLQRVGSFYSVNHSMFRIGWMAAMDIDDEEDLQMARACYLVKNGQFNASLGA